MKTIRAGDKDLLKEYKYFQCNYCGWIGKAEKDEYRYCGSQIDGDRWKVKCPCCSSAAYNIEDKRLLAAVQKEEAKMDNADYWESR